MPYKDIEVRRAYVRNWRKVNAEYVSSFDKQRWRNNPERKLGQQRRHELNPNKRAESVRKCYYGINADEYNARVQKQNNLCAICGKPETVIDYRTKKVQSLSVDHSHATGKNRELLCSRCNRGIGMFNENIELLELAIQYLKKHKEP